MNVHLLAFTPHAERVCAIAARTCYSPETPSHIAATITDNEIGRVLARCVTSGHLSVLEHAVFSFTVDGISRACSHQLVRHRMASFSQQSQRYVPVDVPDRDDPCECWEQDIQMFVLPPAAYDIGDATVLTYQEDCLNALEAYRDMVAAGVPAEDARYILPNATKTDLVMTMNARELRHFFSLRCCRRAQWEVRALAWAIRDLCMDVAPLLFAGSGPGCMTGGCSETEPCGKPYGSKA